MEKQGVLGRVLSIVLDVRDYMPMNSLGCMQLDSRRELQCKDHSSFASLTSILLSVLSPWPWVKDTQLHGKSPRERDDQETKIG